MKVYISQPMRGLSDEQIRKDREEVVEWVKAHWDDVEILETYHPEWAEAASKHNDRRIYFLGQSITMMSDADMVVMLNDYNFYDGCICEEKVAGQYRIRLEYYHTMRYRELLKSAGLRD